MANENDDTSRHIDPSDASQKTKKQWIDEAKIYQSIGRSEDALTAFDRAIQLDPPDVTTYKDKANMLYDLQRYQDALTTFEHVLRLDPNDAESYRKKTDILILLGQYISLGEEQLEGDKENRVWSMLSTPDALEICERIIGISFPLDKQLVIISYRGIYTVALDGSWLVQHDYTFPEGGALYDRKNHILDYHGKRFQILGVFGGNPIFQNKYGERIVFAPNREPLHPGQQSRIQAFRVQGPNGDTLLEFQFEDPSSDWLYVSFSPDSISIVVVAPYNFYVFQRVA